MIETTFDIKTPDGTADAALYAPDAGPAPGIIIYTDILGNRPAFAEMAARLVKHGYTVMIPNVYYRVSKMPVFDFPAKFGEEKTVARIGELRPSAAPDLIARDVGPYTSALLARPETSGSLIGTVGYCMGGSMALRTAAAMPDAVAAAASFHGSRLYSDEPDSPHLLLPLIRARLYFGFSVEDKTMPVEAVEKFTAALDAAGSDWDGETYEGARHGWCVKDHNVYNERQAERAWAKLMALFDSTLR